MEKVFVDTGGWAALFGDNDENHETAASIFEGLKKSKIPLYTSDYIIDETVTLTMTRGNHAQSVQVGKALFESAIVKIVHVAPDYLKGSWELYQKYKDKRLSFTDVTTLTITKALNIKKIFSFDRELQRAGADLLT